VMTAEFQRLMVFGEWDHPYVTMSFRYQADIARALGKLVARGLVYKGKKPVHWCIHCRTALAEAEVEPVTAVVALTDEHFLLDRLRIFALVVGREDAVFADRLNHASLNDACLLSRAQFKRYPHGKLEALEKMLRTVPARRKLIVTDAVFSMDGDIAMLPELVALAGRHDAWLVADDAHGFGVLGECGRGALSHFGIATPRVIYMATLGKAAGVFGAFVAGHPTAVEYLSQRARSYVYTTATPPLLAHAVLESLRLIEAEQWRRDRLAQLIRVLKHGLAANPWRLLPSVTAIQPLVIGSNAEAIAVSERLAERGLLVPAIRPPTVPQGTARLRISLSAAHSEDDVGRLVEALNDIARQ